MNEFEARAIEAIVKGPLDKYDTNIRLQDVISASVAREALEVRTIRSELELASERDRMRRECLRDTEGKLEDALKEVEMLEQRERDLEARAEEAERQVVAIPRVDQSVYDEADKLMAGDVLMGVMDEMDRITPPDDDKVYMVAFLVACLRCRIPADVIRERMSRA
ncbi:MAG: hypothetical protein AAGL99_16990 [Pseudomonadota bacterium]